MMDIKDQDNYFSNIAQIVNFFEQTRHSGLLFCSIETDIAIKEINRIIIEKCKLKSLEIKELYLSSGDLDTFFDKIKTAASEKINGLIITNLNELIFISKGSIIKNINYAGNR
jgi:hypothetical protein